MNFGNLPSQYSSEESAEIVLLPVPFDLTTSYQKGTALGPKALIEASHNLELYDIETDSEVFRHGIHTAPPIFSEKSEELLRSLYLRTKELLKQNKFVVTLGGEHSISSAPIQAHAEKHGSISILQFDAHTDLRESYENNPFSHASVMARAKEIPQVEAIVSVGIRSMDIEEKSSMDLKKTFFSHDIHTDPLWIAKVLPQLSDQIYITFDLDVFDSSLMPSTGTPEPGGLFWHQVFSLLKTVSESKQIVGFDVVELMPISHFKAPDFLAAKVVYKLLSYIFKQRSPHHARVHEKTFQTL